MIERQTQSAELRDNLDTTFWIGAGGLDKREFPSTHVIAERLQQVGHLIVEHIHHEPLVLLQQQVFRFLLYRTESLGSLFSRFSGQRIA